MNFAIRKLPLAEEDALDSAIWYEKRQAGLGEDFLDEVDRAVQRLSGEALHLLGPICRCASHVDTPFQILRDLLEAIS